MSGKAQDEQTNKQGRPKNEVEKKRITIYLSLKIIDLVDQNCRGNKSVFIEDILRGYFHNIKKG